MSCDEQFQSRGIGADGEGVSPGVEFWFQVLEDFFVNPTVIGACFNGRGFGRGAVGGVGFDVIGEPRCIDDDQLPTGAQKSLPVEQSGQRIAQGSTSRTDW
ncbi:MAG: hypothetical protein ACTHWM_06655 [Yaniella sp.]|uniref:hypothetical protein n=1 Tax=Yaniella sp. TaxID=2773929 RepID=UPI003F9D046A